MARVSFSPQDLQKLRELAASWGKMVARHAFDEQGPGTDVDLTTREEVALAAAAGLTEGTLGTLLEQQGRRLGPQQACPAWGHLCLVRKEPRPLDVRGGTLQLDEPIGHCPDCRRDFFPQRPCLRLDNHRESSALVQQMLELAGQLRSFQQAALLLRHGR